MQKQKCQRRTTLKVMHSEILLPYADKAYRLVLTTHGLPCQAPM